MKQNPIKIAMVCKIMQAFQYFYLVLAACKPSHGYVAYKQAEACINKMNYDESISSGTVEDHTKIICSSVFLSPIKDSQNTYSLHFSDKCVGSEQQINALVCFH